MTSAARGTLIAEVDGGVGCLTLDRPEVGNAIDLPMALDLLDVASAWADDPGVRAVLVRGAGSRFCVGGDLQSFAGQEDLPQHLTEITTALHGAITWLTEMDAPVVAAVQGSAAGAGVGLACCADLVLVGRSARFVVAFTAVGLTPDSSTSWILPRVIGLRRALELTLTNRALGADEAVAWGLATRVVDDGELDVAARELAATLAGGPTRALGGAKRLVRESLDHDLARHLDLESQSLAAAAGTADGREGIAAFLDKRAPSFGGES